MSGRIFLPLYLHQPNWGLVSLGTPLAQAEGSGIPRMQQLSRIPIITTA
jgi:hypothetical protein